MYDCFIQKLVPTRKYWLHPPSETSGKLQWAVQNSTRSGRQTSVLRNLQLQAGGYATVPLIPRRPQIHGPLLLSAHVGDNSMNWRLAGQLSASYRLEGAPHGFLLCFLAPWAFQAKPGSWSLFGCFRVMQKSQGINNYSGWWKSGWVNTHSFLLCSWITQEVVVSLSPIFAAPS